MNETLQILNNRRSIRLYTHDPISEEERGQILKATLRAPTAGNMMLYTIIEVTNQTIKERLAETCDHQPFIAKAPWVLLFLADYQRWFDYYKFSEVENKCREREMEFRTPHEGDLMLACCDALIAAQTAVIAAESLGIGSCYIGDILERYEDHRELFNLPRYVFPITLVCFGRSAKTDPNWKLQPRFDQRFIVHQNSYQPLTPETVAEFEKPMTVQNPIPNKFPPGIDNLAQRNYFNKFCAGFTYEMTRSVKLIMKNWIE